MALKLVQRAKKSELRASVTNIQPLRTTRTEDYQTTRASSVFSPKIFSSRKGLDNVRESIATMPRDISQVNVWQMMKVRVALIRLRVFGLKFKLLFIISMNKFRYSNESRPCWSRLLVLFTYTECCNVLLDLLKMSIRKKTHVALLCSLQLRRKMMKSLKLKGVFQRYKRIRNRKRWE